MLVLFTILVSCSISSVECEEEAMLSAITVNEKYLAQLVK